MLFISFFHHSSFSFFFRQLSEQGVHFFKNIGVNFIFINHPFVILRLVSSSTHINPEFEPIDQSSSSIPDSGIKDEVLLIDGVSLVSGVDSEGISILNILGNLGIEKIELTGVKRGHVVIGGFGDNFFFIVLTSVHSGLKSHVSFSFISSNSSGFFFSGSESVHPNLSEFLSFNSEFEQFVGGKSVFTDVGEFN